MKTCDEALQELASYANAVVRDLNDFGRGGLVCFLDVPLSGISHELNVARRCDKAVDWAVDLSMKFARLTDRGGWADEDIRRENEAARAAGVAAEAKYGPLRGIPRDWSEAEVLARIGRTP